MHPLVKSTAFRVWLLLVAVTVFSWTLVEETGLVHAGVTVALLLAGVKVTMVVAHFMEVRWQPSPWRLVLTGWTVGVLAIILGGYWVTVLQA